MSEKREEKEKERKMRLLLTANVPGTVVEHPEDNKDKELEKDVQYFFAVLILGLPDLINSETFLSQEKSREYGLLWSAAKIVITPLSDDFRLPPELSEKILLTSGLGTNILHVNDFSINVYFDSRMDQGYLYPLELVYHSSGKLSSFSLPLSETLTRKKKTANVNIEIERIILSTMNIENNLRPVVDGVLISANNGEERYEGLNS